MKKAPTKVHQKQKKEFGKYEDIRNKITRWALVFNQICLKDQFVIILHNYQY